MQWGGPAGAIHPWRPRIDGAPHGKTERFSRSLTEFEQNSTLIAVIEMSLSSWLVAGIVPGLERHPLKKLSADKECAAGEDVKTALRR